MKTNLKVSICAAAGVLAGCFNLGTHTETVCDIVIYGSSPAAIAAAVQAKRMGVSAVIVSPETRIGGLTTGGRQISEELGAALEEGQIRPWLQPIVDRDGKTIGAEALVRCI